MAWKCSLIDNITNLLRTWFGLLIKSKTIDDKCFMVHLVIMECQLLQTSMLLFCCESAIEILVGDWLKKNLYIIADKLSFKTYILADLYVK